MTTTTAAQHGLLCRQLRRPIGRLKMEYWSLTSTAASLISWRRVGRRMWWRPRPRWRRDMRPCLTSAGFSLPVPSAIAMPPLRLPASLFVGHCNLTTKLIGTFFHYTWWIWRTRSITGSDVKCD